MKKRLPFLFLPLLFLLPASSNAQYWQQYFDGADTNACCSIFVQIDTANGPNTWQIGRPQKIIFDSASTFPNALVTDTINSYPVNDTSSFGFTVSTWTNWGVLAIQWRQKLDLEQQKDGGVIEYSLDGLTWHNAFNDPYVYNFYGFLPQNQDTLANGEEAFSGTDSTWRDIWLCFDMSFVSLQDTFMFRYTLQSDSAQTNQEGWMIDNLLVHLTMIHTAGPEPQKEYIRVFPSVTDGIVNIQCKKLTQFHIIESMELYDGNGRLVESYGTAPTKFYIDIRKHPPGMYFLRVNTNMTSMTFPVVLQKP